MNMSVTVQDRHTFVCLSVCDICLKARRIQIHLLTYFHLGLRWITSKILHTPY